MVHGGCVSSRCVEQLCYATRCTTRFNGWLWVGPNGMACCEAAPLSAMCLRMVAANNYGAVTTLFSAVLDATATCHACCCTAKELRGECQVTLLAHAAQAVPA